MKHNRSKIAVSVPRGNPFAAVQETESIEAVTDSRWPGLAVARDGKYWGIYHAASSTRLQYTETRARAWELLERFAALGDWAPDVAGLPLDQRNAAFELRRATMLHRHAA